MKTRTIEIPKDVYDRAQKRNGLLAKEDETTALFSIYELYGAGIYYNHCYEKDGKYYCRYNIGENAD